MPKLKLNRDRAWAYVLLNLSVPGWGSLKAGRVFTGIGEMVIVLTGLLFLGTWMFEWMNRIFQSELGNPLPPPPSARLWKWGIGLIGVSCVWTTATCISLIREAKIQEEKDLQNAPPVLAEPPKPPKLS
jgi:hypothetical protein